MGNALSEAEKKTNSLLYMEVSKIENKIKILKSLQQSYITAAMIELMLYRWNDLGKPLFMIHREFKEQILSNLETEIKLNYQKWLQQSLDIDVFEIMIMLIFYARCSLEQRLECKCFLFFILYTMIVIFRLFCFND